MLNKLKINTGLTKKLEREKRREEKQESVKIVPKEVIVNAHLQSIIICDIDGTLAIRGNRGIFDFNICDIDTLCKEVQHLLALVHLAGGKVVLMTGREDKFRSITEKWLKDNEVVYGELLMRQSEDKRPDYIIKKELYEKHIKDKYNVFAIFEDRPQVVKMWRAEGFYVFDCNQIGTT